MLFTNRGIQESSYGEEEISTEAMSMIVEAAMLDTLTDEEITTFCESHIETNQALDEEIVTEKTIVRLDKKAKLSQAQKMSVFTIAKEKNDPKFKKLVTVWRMERVLEDELFKRYGNEGLRRAKKAMASASQSKSKTLKKASKSVNSQLRLLKK